MQVQVDHRREGDEFSSVLEPGDRAELARILGELLPDRGLVGGGQRRAAKCQ